MHPTVLIVAVLLLHGVSGHLFQRALPHKLTKHMQFNTRQSDAEVDECINKRLEEALTNSTSCLVAAEETETEFDDDDDDQSQEVINAIYSVFCRPECGNVFISAADECGYFEGDDALLRDVLIDLCGTNENGDKCYELIDEALDTINSQDACLETYFTTEVCTCRPALLEDVREHGCCLDIYYDIVQEETDYKVSDFYDACDVNYPSGCNNSPLGSGFMPQVALVTLISALIFSVLLS